MEEEQLSSENCSFTQSEYWSKEKLNNLISLYFAERDLWDTTRSPTFNQRQEGFERIANILGCDGWCNLVDDSNSECTDSQLNAEHWFARIEKLYHRNICLLIINNYSNLQMPIRY